MRKNRITLAVALLAAAAALAASFFYTPQPAGAALPAAQSGSATFSRASIPGLSVAGERVEPQGTVLVLRNDTGRALKGVLWYRNDAAGKTTDDAGGAEHNSARLFTNNMDGEPLAAGAQMEVSFRPSQGAVRVAALAFVGGDYEGEPEAVATLRRRIDEFEGSLAALLDDIEGKFPQGARGKPKDAEAFAHAVRSRYKVKGQGRIATGLTPAQAHLAGALEYEVSRGKTPAAVLDEFAAKARKRLGRQD